MSDQDEISRLLAEAAAQSDSEANRVSTDPSAENANAASSPENPAATAEKPPTPTTVRKHPPRLLGRSNDVLGLVWLNGTLHIATFHRQKMARSWACPTSIRTVAEFEAVIDDALAEVEFSGTETFLVLENEIFIHQADDIPLFSENVLKSYLKNRIQRHEQEHGPALWVMQPLIAQRQEQSILLHLLPKSFYNDLHRVLLKRHLELTRILPLIVPLQYELNRIPAGKNTTVLVAVETGSSTALVAGRIGGPLFFSRTILADLNHEPARIGIEVNRSLLYTKQHFENTASSIWLMAKNGKAAADAITAKCGAGKKVVILPSSSLDWLQTTAKLSPQQPINLLLQHLKTKRRNQFIRGGLLVALWLGLALAVSSHLSTAADWRAEQTRLFSLRDRASALRAERDHLVQRNQEIERNETFVAQVKNDRLIPVSARFLNFVATILPESARLAELNLRWESESRTWTFQFNGMIEADDETARTLISGVQDQLAKSPLRARFNENARVVVSATALTPGAVEMQRFNLEGILFEK
jgi:hypothetical protein